MPLGKKRDLMIENLLFTMIYDTISPEGGEFGCAIAAGPDRLRRTLAAIRRQGCCFFDHDGERGLSGIAAPVFDAGGNAVAAIHLSGPSDRMHFADQHLEEIVVETARLISEGIC
jgi:DNA-binding IclR family transcriptional regulator